MSKVEIKKYKTLDEKLYTKVLDNGLTVYIVPKKDYHKVYMTFSTSFGADVNRFVPIDKEEYIDVPLGVAHFLEHKLFEMPDGTDASNIFASLGADSNAYTSFCETAYLVSCVDKVNECLTKLLDFVQTPYFTKESVEKEKGIIIQELQMYNNKPSHRLYQGILNAMYMHDIHRFDVVGTEESINEINEEILYTCYNTFYHPSNMFLSIVGGVEVEEVLKLIEENQSKKVFRKAKPLKKHFLIEDNTVYRKSGSCKMDIIIPRCCVGIKLPSLEFEHNELLSCEIRLKIMLESVFGVSSNNYQEMLDKEIISNFNYSTSLDNTAGYIRLYANTNKPKEFIDYIKDHIGELKNFIIEENDLQRLKNAYMGSYLKSFNSVEFISTNINDYKVLNCDFLDVIDIINDIKSSDFKEISDFIVSKAISTYVVYPKNLKN